MDIADSVQSITGPPVEGLASTHRWDGREVPRSRQTGRESDRDKSGGQGEGSGKAEIRKRASKGGREEGSTLEGAMMKGEERGGAGRGRDGAE